MVAPAAVNERLWDTLPVDGVVVVDPRAGDLRVADLRARGLTMVTIDRDPSHDDRWYVDTVAAAGTREMLEHLSLGGVRSVALVTWELDDSFNLDSEQEYVRWAGEHGREPLVERWDPPRYGVDLRRAEALVRRSDVDAVYCLTQRFAASVLDAARLAGRSVPEDLLGRLGGRQSVARWRAPRRADDTGLLRDEPRQGSGGPVGPTHRRPAAASPRPTDGRVDPPSAEVDGLRQPACDQAVDAQKRHS